MTVQEKKEFCSKWADSEVARKSLEDLDYFSCLYGRYEAKMIRYIRRLVFVSQEEAEDILQESFIKVWRYLNSFDSAMKFSSWIYRIVHNEAISFWRKKKSFGKDQQVTLDENLYKNESGETENPAETEYRDLLTHEVLDLLPLKYRTVLVLRFMEGMSYGDISDVLKMPEGTVATQINRAKKAFAKIAGKKHYSFDLQ
ncbi:MAG: RNA polymerase sigma factor [Bacteroidia bacterium]